MSHHKHQSSGHRLYQDPVSKNPTRKQPEALAQGDPLAQGTEEWLLPGVLQSWAHPSSSEPSAQSFSPSHRYSWATHPVPSRQGTCVREQDRWRTGVRGCAGLDRRRGVGVTTRAELLESEVVVVGCGAVILAVKDRVVLVAGCTVVVLVSVVRAVVGAGVVFFDVDCLVVVCDVVALLVGAGVVVSAVVVWLGSVVVVEVVG